MNWITAHISKIFMIKPSDLKGFEKEDQIHWDHNDNNSI